MTNCKRRIFENNGIRLGPKLYCFFYRYIYIYNWPYKIHDVQCTFFTKISWFDFVVINNTRYCNQVFVRSRVPCIYRLGSNTHVVAVYTGLDQAYKPYKIMCARIMVCKYVFFLFIFPGAAARFFFSPLFFAIVKSAQGFFRMSTLLRRYHRRVVCVVIGCLRRASFVNVQSPWTI